MGARGWGEGEASAEASGGSGGFRTTSSRRSTAAPVALSTRRSTRGSGSRWRRRWRAARRLSRAGAAPWRTSRAGRRSRRPARPRAIAGGIEAAVTTDGPSSARPGSSGRRRSPGRGPPTRPWRPTSGRPGDRPLVVVDADVARPQRTGDESYVRNLLRELARSAGPAGIRVAAVTRRPDLVPEGIEPVELRLARRRRCGWPGRSAAPAPRELGAALVHTQYALPLRCPCPAVVTVHDLSFERDASLMAWMASDGVQVTVVRVGPPRRGRVLTVSERSKRDVVELYGLMPARIAVTPNGVDPAFRPGRGPVGATTCLSVGASSPARTSCRASRPLAKSASPLVVAGPEKDATTAAGCVRRNGATLTRLRDDRGARCALPRCCVPRPGFPLRGLRASRARGDGVRDAGRHGSRARRSSRSSGDAAVVVSDDAGLAGGIRRALDDRERLVRGRSRARAGVLVACDGRRATLAVYLEALAR